MFDDLNLDLLWLQLWHLQNSPEYVSNTGCGQGWQTSVFKLLYNFLVILGFLDPGQFHDGLNHKAPTNNFVRYSQMRYRRQLDALSAAVVVLRFVH